MGPLLQDPKRSSIRIVLNPERMVINESQRLYTYLSLFGFPVDAVIANRVLPEEARSAYFDRWFEHPGRAPRRRRAQAFDPLPFFEAPLFDREMVGTEMLDEFGRRRLRRRPTPRRSSTGTSPMEVKKEGRGYALYLRLPFAEKDRIQVFAEGDELVVQVDNQRRHLVLPRTLAGAAGRERRLRRPAPARGVRSQGGVVSRREARAGTRRRKPCCMVSEILEEAGHRPRARAPDPAPGARGRSILMCQWQLQRMEQDRRRRKPPGRRGRKVEVE